MSKNRGKKFDAAEKHFMGKEKRYQQEIKRLSAELQEARRDLTICKRENEALNKKLELAAVDPIELDARLASMQKIERLSPVIQMLGPYGKLMGHIVSGVPGQGKTGAMVEALHAAGITE